MAAQPLPNTRCTSSLGHPQIPVVEPRASCRGGQALSLLLHGGGLTLEWTLNFHWCLNRLSSDSTCRGCGHTTVTPSTYSDICRRGIRRWG